MLLLYMSECKYISSEYVCVDRCKRGSMWDWMEGSSNHHVWRWVHLRLWLYVGSRVKNCVVMSHIFVKMVVNVARDYVGRWRLGLADRRKCGVIYSCVPVLMMVYTKDLSMSEKGVVMGRIFGSVWGVCWDNKLLRV